ncbi:rRNA maturation RNase YbeY [Salinicoccus albus]|uniref:rRNA maturation RNase YbeY n=1 Tax=Salinicoccus albus TaxID=418756 RepID=UPI0003724AC9|nr:rRNA maturation RNase YbeY [Salinicoccus albus]
MLTVDFIDEENRTERLQQQDIDQLLNFAYDYLKQDDDAELSISFVNEEEIQNLNSYYRNKDKVTDVISFALEDDVDNLVHGEAFRTLGDVVICTDAAKEQSEDYGHSYRRELLFLSLHGFLHLLGYDHIKTDEEKEMMRLQDDILEAYGVSREV